MYKAKYYSGKISKPFDCLVKIESGFIWIYPDGYEAQQWPLGQIKHSEFKGIGKNSIRYGNFPFQTLEYDDSSPLAFEINKFLPERQQGFKAFANELVNSGMKGAIILTLLVASALVSVYFFVLPYLAEKIAVRIPQEYEVSFGEKAFETLMASETIDSSKTLALNKFAKKIDFNSDYNLSFTVVNSDIVNAYALPGGRIVVFSAMINEMNKPEQMAALLSHEVSHINKKHSLKNLSRAYSGKIFLSFLVGDTAILDFIADQAQNIYELKYSREMETEADLDGLRILQNNGINQKGMIELMHILEDQENKIGMDIPQYMSTHPVSKNRIKSISKKLINQTKVDFLFNEKDWLNIKIK
jgi:predicted Zn-dependent protease